jgi:hypothetical protein
MPATAAGCCCWLELLELPRVAVDRAPEVEVVALDEAVHLQPGDGHDAEPVVADRAGLEQLHLPHVKRLVVALLAAAGAEREGQARRHHEIQDGVAWVR